MNRLAVMLLLSACATPVALPPPGTAQIEVSSGGSMFGGHSTVIYADGTVVQSMSVPNHDPKTTVHAGTAEAFAAVAAVIAAQGPHAKAAQKPAELQCLDYGFDIVRADPPIAGFDSISAGCPDEAVAALTAAVMAALVPHEP